MDEIVVVGARVGVVGDALEIGILRGERRREDDDKGGGEKRARRHALILERFMLAGLVSRTMAAIFS
jgi:hypothetical protein